MQLIPFQQRVPGLRDGRARERGYDRLPAFATRTKAIEQTKRIIDAETWQRYCEYNVARDMEHANTRKEFNEWCADRDKADWK